MSGRKGREKVYPEVVVVEGAAPETGTKLTSERLSESLRLLNSRGSKKAKKKPAAGA